MINQKFAMELIVKAEEFERTNGDENGDFAPESFDLGFYNGLADVANAEMELGHLESKRQIEEFFEAKEVLEATGEYEKGYIQALREAYDLMEQYPMSEEEAVAEVIASLLMDAAGDDPEAQEEVREFVKMLQSDPGAFIDRVNPDDVE